MVLSARLFRRRVHSLRRLALSAEPTADDDDGRAGGGGGGGGEKKTK